MRKLKSKIYYIISVICLINYSTGYAQLYGQKYGSDGRDLGSSSKNVAGALFDISNLWLAVAMIAGIGFLFVGIVKFFEHRKNPQQTPLGQVILLLFLAFTLIGLYLFLQFGDSGYVMLQQIFD